MIDEPRFKDGDTRDVSEDDAGVEDASVDESMDASADGEAIPDAAPDTVDDATLDMPSVGSVALSLVNTRTSQAVKPGFDFSGPLYRVELPPSVTLAASGPPETQSVSFTVGGETTVDSEAPFLLSEDAWSLSFGDTAVEVRAYASNDGTGNTIATANITVMLSGLGMNATAPISKADNDAFISSMVDGVLMRRTFENSNGVSIAYRLFVPEDYDASVKYPVLMFLHGRGQRGDSNEGTFSSELFQGERSIVSPNMQREFPSIVVVPQCLGVPENQEWGAWLNNEPNDPGYPFGGFGANGEYEQNPVPSDSGLAVMELVGALAGEFSVDEDRVYVTGESMGGLGSWDLTTRMPTLFAAAVPMAGLSDRRTAPRIKDLPLWVFHGDADASNSVEGTREMVAAVRAAGGTVMYTEYAGEGHSPTFTRAWRTELDLLPWIFSQHR